MESIKQIPLNIQLYHDACFANFVVGANQQLIAILQAEPTEQNWCVYLWGKAGEGKSHLLQAACNADQQPALYIPLAEYQHFSPNILENLEQYKVVALDDIDTVSHISEWAEALFHLYNKIHHANHRLIISASKPPKLVSSNLADLSSRLAAATIIQLQPLEDNEKKIALVKYAQQIGLQLTDECVEFLLRRLTRNMAVLFAALDKLDKASMVHKRKLSIPFIKTVLGC